MLELLLKMCTGEIKKSMYAEQFITYVCFFLNKMYGTILTLIML